MVCNGYLDLAIIRVIVIIEFNHFLIYLILILKWRTFEHK
jgi:hypothetical protein